MKKKIMIKSRFFGWQPVTKEQALQFARTLYSGITAKRNKAEYISRKYLKGVIFTDEELRETRADDD